MCIPFTLSYKKGLYVIFSNLEKILFVYFFTKMLFKTHNPSSANGLHLYTCYVKILLINISPMVVEKSIFIFLVYAPFQ